MRDLTFALTKGRLADKTLERLERAGIRCPDYSQDSRKLVFRDPEQGVSFFLVKGADVPTYVEQGAADIGIVGKDVLEEEQRDLYEVLDLGFGRCSMAVAGFPESAALLQNRGDFRVGTKYPQIARAYFMRKHQQPQILKLNGSVELAPIVGLADLIVDIVETGSTLKANGLVVLDRFMDISARMVVNKASMKIYPERINSIIRAMAGGV
ncbi:MAG: ATP phosphoribosyltransferase [Firmicutes bacterium]|nr:ATP phosphoribosyltransferase [Bacillota bacterium]